MQGLEGLATMSMGSLFYVAGTGDPIFERLSSEISAYYLLGVEQRPKDREGDRHRIDVDVRRRGVTIRSRQAFVLSPTANAPKSANDSLRDALVSPFAVSGLPLRVTTFAHHDTASDKVRLMVSAQVGQPGAPKGEFTVGYLLVTDDNRIAGNYLEKRTLEPAGTSGNEPLDFLGGVVVEPGIYTLRFGVIDAEGRRGSVLREVNAWKMAGETLALGDLIVGPMPEAGKGLRAGVEPHVTGDALAAHMELYSTSAATFDKAEVTLDVVEDPDAPALSRHQRPVDGGRQADVAHRHRPRAGARAAAGALRGAGADHARGQGGGRADAAVHRRSRRRRRRRCRMPSARPPPRRSRPRCRSSIARRCWRATCWPRCSTPSRSDRPR